MSKPGVTRLNARLNRIEQHAIELQKYAAEMMKITEILKKGDK